MNDLSSTAEKHLRIRAFRATDDHDTCEKFVQGHRKVLEIFGISEITSNNEAWFYDPDVYVIVAESIETGEVYGGARIQMKTSLTSQPLPIEKAIGEMDNRIFGIIQNELMNGNYLGEICGLWNSRKVAGMGIGSIVLVRCAVAIATHLNLSKLVGICHVSNVKNNARVGYEIITDLGDEGTFYYPKSDLLAAALIINDLQELPTAQQKHKDLIFDLRNQPLQTTKELSRMGEVTIQYQLLDTNNVNQNAFKVREA